MKRALIIAVSIVGTIAQASTSDIQDVLDIKNAAVGGSGCKASGVDFVRVDSESAVLSLQPSKASAKVQKQGLGRLACQIAVPVQLPSDLKLVVEHVEVLSKVSLPKDADARLSVEVFRAGSSGQVVSSSVAGKKKGQLNASADAVFSSDCGEALTLRANSNILIQNRAKKTATVEFQGMDLLARLVKCE